MSDRDDITKRLSRRTALRIGAGGSVGLLGLSSVSQAGAQEGPITITDCGAIDEPGEYVLGDDLSAEGDCLEITASDVTLDGNGYTIDGDGTGTGLLMEASESTVRNLTIQNFGIGITFAFSTNVNISSMTIQDNTIGITSGVSSGILCEDLLIHRNDGTGVSVSDYNRFLTMRNCDVLQNGSNPIRAGSSAAIGVKDCRIVDNGGPVEFVPMPDSKIEGTLVSGSDGAGLSTNHGDRGIYDVPTLIRNCVIEDCDGPGIDQPYGFLDVRGCTLSGNRIGYEVDGSTDPYETTLRYSNIEDNEEYGVLHTRADGVSTTINATCNWWGDESGPVHEDNPNEDPQGQRVSSHVEYVPWSIERIEDGEEVCEGGLDETFDPAIHGFNFPNWAGESGCRDLEKIFGDNCKPNSDECPDDERFEFPFTAEHRLGVDGTRDLIGNWSLTDELNPFTSELLARIVHAMFSRQQISNGHCYGMMFTVKEYFEQPDQLPSNVDSLAELTSPAEYESVGNRIRAYQTSQMIESEIQFLATISFWRDWVDLEQSMIEIQRLVDDDELVPVALGNPGNIGGHQVLVYDYEETVDGTIEFYIHDPQPRADWYKTSSVTLEVDGSTGEPVEAYARPPKEECFFYSRYVPIDPDRVPQEAGIENPAELLTEFLDKVVLSRLNSPASLDVDPPADTEAVDVEGDTGGYSGILSDAAIVLDASPGSYGIQVRGENDGKFTLEVYGDTDDGGRIATEVSDDIGAGETKAFTADVPDEDGEEGEEGEITAAPRDDGPSVADFTNENDIVDTDGLRDAVSDWQGGDIDTDLLQEVFDAWQSGEQIE